MSKIYKLLKFLLMPIVNHWLPITVILLVISWSIWLRAGYVWYMSIFYTLQFLVLNRDIPEDLVSFCLQHGQSSWFLHPSDCASIKGVLVVMQCLILLTISTGFLKTVFHDHWIYMVSRLIAWLLMRDHVVVAGYGTFGKRLVDLHHEQGDKVIVIEPGDSAKSLDMEGVVLLKGDAGDRNLLAYASLKEAKKIYIVTGKEKEKDKNKDKDDDRNVGILKTIESVSGGLPETTINIQLYSREAKRLYAQGFKDICNDPAKTDADKSLHAEVFDMHEMAARALFLRYAPVGQKSPARTIVVVGQSQLAEAFVRTVARLGQIDSPEKDRGNTLRVVWIGVSNEDKESFLTSYPCLRHPEYAENKGWLASGVKCDAEFVNDMGSEVFPLIDLVISPSSPDTLFAPDALEKELAGAWNDISSVIVCTISDTTNMALSKELSYQLERSQNTSKDSVVATSYGIDHPSPKCVKYFNVPDEACRIAVKSEPVIRAGKFLNHLYGDEAFQKEIKEKLSGTDGKLVTLKILHDLYGKWLGKQGESDKLWRNINAEDRLSNIEAVAHILFKLDWLSRLEARGGAQAKDSVFQPEDIKSIQRELFDDHKDCQGKKGIAEEKATQLTSFQKQYGDQLARLEHQRWLAFKLMHGYRFDPKVEKDKNRDYRLNKDVAPFGKLGNHEQKKDDIIISSMPLLLLMLTAIGEKKNS